MKLLLIDDNPDDRILVRRELSREFPEIEVTEIIDAEQLAAALRTHFDIVITDYQLRWSNGLTVLRSIKNRNPNAAVIMFTDTGSEEIAVEAMKAGLHDYVLKSPEHYQRIVPSVRCVIDRFGSERKASHLEFRLQSLLNRLNVGVFRARSTGEILEANPTFLKLIGAESLRSGLRLQELFADKSDFNKFSRDLDLSGRVHEHEVKFQRLDGDSIWVSLVETVSHHAEGEDLIDGLMEDISERMKLEEQVRLSQKMESIGRLAAGIAHDFNNILSIIQGYATLMLSETRHDETSVESLNQISLAAQRASTLTRQLLTFSRKQIVQPGIIDLNVVLRDFSSLLLGLLGDSCKLQLKTVDGLPPVEGDAGMFQQILINLVSNSRDAMPKGGTVAIATTVVNIDLEYCARNSQARVGDFVCLSVSDTGVGMEESTIERLFEPFFTTKVVGKGTGLGLATVYGIVKQHQGWIEVYSALEEGTTFQLYFPVAILPPMTSPARPAVAPETVSDGEAILVVDDEFVLRKLVRDILAREQYQVFDVGSGEEALAVWHREKDRIQLIFSDVKMPGMTGIELVRRIRQEDKTLPVVLTSGYSHDLNQGVLKDLPATEFLPKPFNRRQLLEIIRRSLQTQAMDGPLEAQPNLPAKVEA